MEEMKMKVSLPLKKHYDEEAAARRKVEAMAKKILEERKQCPSKK